MGILVEKCRLGVACAFVLLASASGCGGDDDSSKTDAQTAGGKNAEAGKAGDTPAASSSGAGAGGAGAGAAAAAGASAGSPGMMGAAGATDDGAPTWSGIYTYTFRSCRVDTCHGGGLVGVAFATKDGAYESLVNQPANTMSKCAMLGKQRVVPNDPDNSLLYLKLDTKGAPCGQQMPPGGQLPDKQIQRVRDWIMLGAKND